MDSILTYHMNPLTCGVARFNHAVSSFFDLPVLPMFSGPALAARDPLLSFKVSEMEAADVARLDALAADPDVWPGLRLFFHDYSRTEAEARLIRRAAKVYCGNERLVAEIAPLGGAVVQAWCPGFLFEKRLIDEGAAIQVYTFGMAHKLRVDHYEKLKRLLDATGQSYRLYISAAVHEGTTLNESFSAAYEELQTIFGDRVYFLGMLSDAALYSFLRTCTFFTGFFPEGVRANNSSVSTAMQCGAVVVTNLDGDSPYDYRHLETVIDIRQCEDALPTEPGLLARIAANGQVAARRLGWDPLLDLFSREEPGLFPVRRPD